MGSAKPLIFSIQHFCLHDGPGIRSLVFFKGCPLRCIWCQNIESWKQEPEIAFKAHLCINCGRCVEKCPEHAFSEVGKRNSRFCRYCFTCTDNCPSGALTRFGVSKSVEDLMEELRPEFSLFKTSGGGVTFTGGEPTLYPEFSSALAKNLHAEGIDVTLETCGLFNLEKIRPLLQELQLMFFDIKVFDEARHRKLCGAGNTDIKNNLKSLVNDWNKKSGPFVWPRLPIVPDMTDGYDNIKGWAGFLNDLGISFLTIVPYHPMGANKRRWLGLPPTHNLRIPTDEEIHSIERLFLNEGIKVYKPGGENIKEHYTGA
ncbi:MAG: hypothetical protein APR62_12320 [Smithella sp. SDB]|nr:MAG: hypothetical protein APR62_12320 [Smithella sp. SDB]